MADTALYAEIVKAERNADGDLVVVGKASGPDLDLDQQICDPRWLSKAMPEWMSTGGNLREQHSAIAAGVATELSQKGDDWMVAGLIVDPVSARKVEKRVLKGFSVGVKNPQIIKDAAAPGGRVVGGSVVEVSLVDRPANPTCTLMLAKAADPDTPTDSDDVDTDRGLVKVEKLIEQPSTEDPAEKLDKEAPDVEAPAQLAPQASEVTHTAGDSVTVKIEGSGLDQDELVKRIVAELAKRQFTAAERDNAADKDQALPDGSFPIKTVQDAKNAIRAIGRAKDPAEAKAHIKKRLGALKRPDLIPDDWKAAAADLTKADGEQVHDPAEIATVRDGLISLIKAELDELSEGDPELCDVGELLCSLKYLMYWWEGEAAAGETDAPYDRPQETVLMAADADTTKTTVTGGGHPDTSGRPEPTDGPTTPSGVSSSNTTTPADAGDVTKTSEPDDSERLAELVKSAVADAMTASEERMKALEADLQKALSLPEPGGPVLTRTASQEATARKSDAAQMEIEANDLLRKAAAATDPYLRQGYRERAQTLLDKASA